VPAGPAAGTGSSASTAMRTPHRRSSSGPSAVVMVDRCRTERVMSMRRSTAAIGTAVYFAVAAGTFAVLVPWLVTGWQLHRPLPGGWHPDAVGPTQHLVVTGFHRYVRNPIYLGSLMIFVGEALLFGSRTLLAYAVVGWAGRRCSCTGMRNPRWLGGSAPSTRSIGGRCPPGGRGCIRGRLRTNADALRW